MQLASRIPVSSLLNTLPIRLPLPLSPNAKSFPLLKLPFELRLQIYKFLPSSAYPILALCSHQIHAEIQPLIQAYCALVLDFSQPQTAQPPLPQHYTLPRITPWLRLVAISRTIAAKIQRVVLYIHEPRDMFSDGGGSLSLESALKLLGDRLSALEDFTIYYRVPDASRLYLRNHNMAIHRLGNHLRATARGEIATRRRDRVDSQGLGRKGTIRNRLILACGGDLVGPDWLFEELGKLLSKSGERNSVQHLEVWIPMSAIEDPPSLANKLKSPWKPGYDEYRSWTCWDGTYWIRNLARFNAGFESVRIMRYDHKRDIGEQVDCVLPLEVEGLQEFLDDRMLIDNTKKETPVEMGCYHPIE